MMKRYVCKECGYVYDPKEGQLNRISSETLVQDYITSHFEPVTPVDNSQVREFSSLLEDWTCPRCGAGKDKFEPEDE